MTFINDIIWQVIRTKPFDAVRPKLTRSDSYRLYGKRQTSNSNFSATILGREETVTYFSKLIFLIKPQKLYKGRQSLRNIATSNEPQSDLSIIDTTWAFSPFLNDNGFFVSPRVDFVLDITGPLDGIRKRMTYGKRRRIAKIAEADWSFEIAKDPAKLRFFYDEMYLPHMLMRHGALAMPISYSEFSALLSQGYLMLIKKGQEYVSGMLLVHQGDELRSFIIGVRDVENGFALSSLAAWYYAIVQGNERGYAKLDCGETPPFIMDGGFQYKKELGAQLRPPNLSSAQVFGLRFSETSKPVKDFLSSNPFVFMDGTNLSGIMHIESMNELSDSCFIPGLSGLYVVTSNLDFSNPKNYRAKLLSSTDILTHKIRALGRFGAACKAEGYSIYHVLL